MNMEISQAAAAWFKENWILTMETIFVYFPL